MWQFCLIHSSFLIIGAWNLLALLQLVCVWSFRACFSHCNLYVFGASEFVEVIATCMYVELQSLLQLLQLVCVWSFRACCSSLQLHMNVEFRAGCKVYVF
jgi:hypothetical protein